MMLVLANTDIPRLALDPATVRMLAWALGGYVLFLLAISIYASRRAQTEADYLVAAVTLTYTMIGGMWSVTLTDTFQIVIALAGLVVLLGATLSHPALGVGDPLLGLRAVSEKGAASHPDHLRLVPAELKAAALLPWLAAWATGLFGNIPGQDLQQRVFASKSPNVAIQACILAGVLYLVFGMIPVTLGLASLVTHPNGTLDPVGFLAGENLSPGMLVVFMVAVVSMVVSTATSAVLAPATILGHNLLSRIPGLRGHRVARRHLPGHVGQVADGAA